MKKILILSTCILWCSGIFAQDKKVAVFDPAGDAKSGIKEIVREEISSVIVNTSGYTVLERQLINKVLEENKFQMGGLVDDSQIGEIGKKMGANYVFVTSITPTGSNLYISCKMIDVQTARIEMQKTGRTTRGENDLDVVVQKVVHDMLGTGYTAAVEEAQPVKTVQQPIRALSPVQGLIADGMKVFSDGRRLNKNEVRGLFINTDALKIYNKGISKRQQGNIFLWSGVGAAALGGFFLIGEASSPNASALTPIGAICTGTGIASVVTGVIFRINAKKYVEEAVSSYNSRVRASGVHTPELKFGFTHNGIGLVYTF
jgi:hypothetical protein